VEKGSVVLRGSVLGRAFEPMSEMEIASMEKLI